MIITPKNWDSFQHYKNRAPIWIKLHRDILDNYDFWCLPVASRALAPCLWLLASEYDDGKIEASLDEIAFRFRMTRGDVAEALNPLLEKGFFSASEPLAERKQDAIPEKRREREEIEIEKEKEPAASAAPQNFSPEPEVQLFQRGKELFGKSAGGLIKQLLTAKNNNVALARAALEQASQKQNAREYIGAIIRSRNGSAPEERPDLSW